MYLVVVGDIALRLHCQSSNGTRHTSLKAVAGSHIHQVRCTGICSCQANQAAYRPYGCYLQGAQEAVDDDLTLLLAQLRCAGSEQLTYMLSIETLR